MQPNLKRKQMCCRQVCRNNSFGLNDIETATKTDRKDLKQRARGNKPVCNQSEVNAEAFPGQPKTRGLPKNSYLK